MTKEKEEIPYAPGVPPSQSGHRLPGGSGYYAAGSFGALVLHTFECPGFFGLHAHFIARQTNWLQLMLKAPELQLRLMLRGHLRFHQEGAGELRIPEGHFNILGTPWLKNKAGFDTGKEYTTFDLHFTRETMEPFVLHFPLLNDFLRKTDRRSAIVLSPVHARVTPQMVLLLRDILFCKLEAPIRQMYQQQKMNELLLIALTRITPAMTSISDIRLQQYDIDKIREAREYLLLNMEHPLTVIELAHKVGINDFKLKKGFKHLYGVTIFDFLLEARMDKARTLLQSTDTPVHEIAFATGYKNVSSFTAAFKKKMGHPPSAFRKGVE